MNSDKPLIVQSNNSLLLEVDSPQFESARDAISVFAHLEKSPEHIHSYKITPLSLWNAAALGITTEDIIGRLTTFSKYDIPNNVRDTITDTIGRFGVLRIEKRGDGLVLSSRDPQLLLHLGRHPSIRGMVGEYIDDSTMHISPAYRGLLKQKLIGIGYPAYDAAGYVDGTPFPIEMRSECKSGAPLTIREYQKQATEGFFGSVDNPGGSGVVVLPCGAGKTVVGIYAMSLLKRSTLILITNVTAAHQWRREICDKSTIPDSDIGEYSGELKEIKPITLATYQILTYRKSKDGPFLHYDVFNAQNWGLIIYDEVHLLPAPVFKFSAELQARRRLGLTATLVREDGHEDDVFALIGPKKFDMPWKDLERQGWIAAARCVEVRVDLPAGQRLAALTLTPREQIRLAYENPFKIDVARCLVQQHSNDQVLIIGQYLSQLHEFARAFNAPLISGEMPNLERDHLYDAFRRGEIKLLILSKVGNFAIDLPDANVAIQISGSFGSRQEEAQRLGRILRPKKKGEKAIFYSIVTRESKELDFAMNRQLFLTEQGYAYDIKYWDGINKTIE